jgi:hypothetical protein
VAAAVLHCLNCLHAIPRDYWNDPAESTCRVCHERLFARVFPAFDRVIETPAPARLEGSGQSSCFYHATNQASVACDDCGRFLCTLCDLDLDGRHLCPGCLQRQVAVEKAASLDARRFQYDTLALHLVTWPAVTIWLPLFTAPAALYFVVRHWNTPMSILPRTRARLWIALLLALVEFGLLAALILAAIWAATRSPR